MKLKSKVMAIVVSTLLVFTVVGLAACTPKLNENELIVMTQFGGTDGNRATYELGVEAFKKANPNVSVQDRSYSVAEGTDSKVEQAFNGHANTHPDVVYHFAPARNQSIKRYLAKISDIREKYPEYGVGFDDPNPDEYTLAFLGNTFGVYYKTTDFVDADFDSYTSLIAKLTSENAPRVVDFNGEPHYWFNYIGVNKMGDKWMETPNKEWFEKYRTEIIGIINELKTVYQAMGLSGSPTVKYADEKLAMNQANRSIAVEGNWIAGSFYDYESTTTNEPIFADEFEFKSLPFDNDSDSQPYIMAGFFSGWMISQTALNNPTKLKNAVAFVQEQLKNVAKFGGISANGESIPSEYSLIEQTKDVYNNRVNGAKIMSPLDDRIVSSPAKAELFDKLIGSLQGGSDTAQQIVDSVISMF